MDPFYMTNKPKASDVQNFSEFLQHFEKGVESMIDELLVEFGEDKNLARSYLKRHVQLVVYSNLDRIIKKLIP